MSLASNSLATCSSKTAPRSRSPLIAYLRFYREGRAPGLSQRNARGSRYWSAILLVAALATVCAPAASAQQADLGRCDPLDPSVCLQPWPNDYFTVPDKSTDTGLRVNLDLAS